MLTIVRFFREQTISLAFVWPSLPKGRCSSHSVLAPNMTEQSLWRT